MIETNANHINREDQLLQAIIEDNKIAYEELFEQFYAPLCVYAKRYVEDRDSREDIVEEVFATIWEKRKSILITSSTKGYLITCVKNQCLNFLRKENNHLSYCEHVREEHLSFVENTEELFTLNELEAMLKIALDKLPPEYRIALEMSYNKNISLNEIAEKIGVSTRTVERYRDKATELLRKELKDYLPIALYLIHQIMR